MGHWRAAVLGVRLTRMGLPDGRLVVLCAVGQVPVVQHVLRRFHQLTEPRDQSEHEEQRQELAENVAEAHHRHVSTGTPAPARANTRSIESVLVATRTTLSIPKMDCPSEERLIRLALAPLEGVTQLDFDLESRQLAVVHADGLADRVLGRLEPLGLGASWVESRPASELDIAGTTPAETAEQARTLWVLLGINGGMFVVELALGLWGQSTGLIADSLDMLADALVYSVSLYAVGRAATAQRRAAHLSGILQLLLALGALTEVGRRAVFGSEPVEAAMMGVGLLALLANLACVALLARHRDGGLHLKASWIFTTTDALANVGVILAGALVWWTGSSIPDLVVGGLVGLLVLTGAGRILRMASAGAE